MPCNGPFSTSTPGIRAALNKDEANIVVLFKDMMGDDAAKNNILKLQGEDAESLLTLIHNVGLIPHDMPYNYSQYLFSDDGEEGIFLHLERAET